MKLKTVVFCVLVAHAGGRLLFAGDSDLKTIGSDSVSWSDGRAWVSMGDHAVKSIYLLGLLDQLKFDAMEKAADSFLDEASKGWAPGFTVGDYVKVLDEMYAQPENLPIPIPVAVRYCTAKLEGELTPTELDGMLVRIRKALNKIARPAVPAEPPAAAKP